MEALKRGVEEVQGRKTAKASATKKKAVPRAARGASLRASLRSQPIRLLFGRESIVFGWSLQTDGGLSPPS